MSKYQNNSPFCQVKNILKVLRFTLSFPLKPVDNEYAEFTFSPCLEYLRYAIYILIAFGSKCGIYFFFVKHGNASDPFAAIQNTLSTVGLSQLDLLVWQFLPLINYISCFCYIISFKNSVKQINKICLILSNINQEFGLLICSSATNHHIQKKKSLTQIYLGVTVGVIGLIFWICFNCGLILEGAINEGVVQPTELAPYGIAVTISGLMLVYPAMLSMADFFICHLLEALGNAFESWNKMLKLKQCDDSKTVARLCVKGYMKTSR